MKIEICQDYSPENPSDWGTLAPMLVADLENTRMRCTEYGLDAPDAPDVREHFAAILEMLGYASLREFAKDRYWTRGDSLEDLLADALTDHVDQLDGSDMLEAYNDLYRMHGYETLLTSSAGHRQGDYAEMLLVATPQYLETTGIQPEHVQEALRQDAKTWSQWAWGDVYSATIEDDDGQVLESCAGFYGYDREESGLADFVREACANYADDLRAALKDLRERMARACQALRANTDPDTCNILRHHVCALRDEYRNNVRELMQAKAPVIPDEVAC